MAFLQPECSPLIVRMVARFLFDGRHTLKEAGYFPIPWVHKSISRTIHKLLL